MHFRTLAALCTVFAFSCNLFAEGPAYTDPQKADKDFPFQGEYAGEVSTPDGRIKVGVQVIALGEGQFRSVSYIGGLPGEGWNGEEKRELDGKLEDGIVVFNDDLATGEIRDGKMHVKAKGADVSGTLEKIQRSSYTLGEKPPENAIVLFDGTSADGWKNGKMTDDGLLMQGCTSKKMFGDHKIHIEFRLPYQPKERGQKRGNSGIYVQGRYEVQMLDSFGLEGKNNECGGIYEVRDPDVNMCYPPLSWQTYDIDFTAARYDGDKLVSPARITVMHNGFVVHDNVALPGDRSTRAAPVKPGATPGPVYLQNHRNPIRYQNIWVVEKS